MDPLDTDRGDARPLIPGRRHRLRRVAPALPLLCVSLTLAGCFGGTSPDAAPSGAGTTATGAASPTSPTEVTFSLSVGLQSTHLSENVVLQLDGAEGGEWSVTPENPSQILTITALSGDRPYEFAGTYTHLNSEGFLEEKPVTGSGTIRVDGGGFYGIYYDTAQDVYELQRLR